MSAEPEHFQYDTPDSGMGVAALLRKGSFVTLVAQLKGLERGWGRRVRLHLNSTLGELCLETSQEKLPEKLQAGDWVRVWARRRFGEGDTSVTLLRLTLATPDCKTAWVPVAHSHRQAHMQRLRGLLETLEPALQLVFTLALTDAQLQRRFFWRVAAADHHCYPGGLFDQSVEAARRQGLSARALGLAALAALLFDLGKTGDPQLSADASRAEGALLTLAPHRLTARRLEQPIAQARRLAPQLADELEAALFAPASAQSPDAQLAARLAREAVLQSWRPQESS